MAQDLLDIELLSTVVQTAANDAAVALSTIPAGATQATIECQGNACRYRADGTDPTASVGSILYPGDILLRRGERLNWRTWLQAAKFINETAGSNFTLVINYYD